MQRQIEYQRPWLYAKQLEAIFHDKRYCCIEASTKAGKTVGCITWLFEQAAIHGGPGRNFWWVAPIFPQAKIAYRRLKRYLPKSLYIANESELTITLANGAIIWFKGADTCDDRSTAIPARCRKRHNVCDSVTSRFHFRALPVIPANCLTVFRKRHQLCHSTFESNLGQKRRGFGDGRSHEGVCDASSRCRGDDRETDPRTRAKRRRHQDHDRHDLHV
jgi:hypothetical protein